MYKRQVYKLCYEKFFNAPRHISLLCTIGISMLIKNLAQIVFGPETKPVLDIVENKTFTFMLGSVRLDIKLLQIVVIVLVVVLASALTLFFNRTKWGIALRAVSQNKDAAYLVGINVKRMAMIGNCIGSGFGGIAAVSYTHLDVYKRQYPHHDQGTEGMRGYGPRQGG